MKIQWKQTLCALVAAMIWGSAFVAQSDGARLLPPMSFNACRFMVGAAVLGAFLLLRRGWNTRREKAAPQEKPKNGKFLLLGGLCCGTALGVASNLQQIGIGESGAGKAAFITSLYIILVPLFSIVLRKKVSPHIFISVLAAAVGLYLLCIKEGEGFSVTGSDWALILCAVVFAGHILCIDFFAARVDSIKLTCLQFVVAGALSAVGALISERPSAEQIVACAFPILYVGVLSCGVGYTLQTVAQSGGNPTVVTLLLSLESLFGILTEAVLPPHVTHTSREYIGCFIMLAAVLSAQIPLPHRKRAPEQEQNP